MGRGRCELLQDIIIIKPVRMGEDKRLRVLWEGHEDTVPEHLRTVLLSEAFSDVTICCTGSGRLRAHRVVLSAFSSFLHRILMQHCASIAPGEVVLIVHDVGYSDMKRLLDMMYSGYTELPSESLDSFLGAAEAMGIDNLRGSNFKVFETQPRSEDYSQLTDDVDALLIRPTCSSAGDQALSSPVVEDKALNTVNLESIQGSQKLHPKLRLKGGNVEKNDGKLRTDSE